MAELTWRSIDAPNISTRELIQAGGQISDSFNNLGSMLAKREERLRRDVTDRAIAERLAIRDPNALGQIDLTGLDKRVNVRELLGADQQHRTQLTQQLKENEDLLNAQADAKYGKEGLALYEAALSGDKAARERIVALNASDEMFSRFLAKNGKTVAEFTDKYVDNTNDAQTLEANKFAAAEQVRLKEEEFTRADAERARSEAEKAQHEGAYKQGEQFAQNSDPRYTKEEAELAFLKSDAYKNASLSAREYLLKGYEDGWKVTNTPGFGDADKPGQPIYAPVGKIPAVGGQSVSALRDVAQAGFDNAANVRAALTSSITAENPNLQVAKLLEGIKKEPTVTDIISMLKGPGYRFHNNGDVIKMAQANGLSMRELKALLQAGNYDKLFYLDKSNGDRFDEALMSYVNARDKTGEITASKTLLDSTLRPIQDAEKQLQSWLQRADQESTRATGVTVETQKKVMELSQQLRAMQAAALKPKRATNEDE